MSRSPGPRADTVQDSLMMNQSQWGEGADGEEPIEGDTIKALPDIIEDQIFRGFPDQLTKEDYEESHREVEESLKALTKAAVTELKQVVKPHYLVKWREIVIFSILG